MDLPPGSTVETISAGLDADEDGQLTKRELRRRPLLFAQLDVDRSSIVEPDELQRAEAVLLRWGVESGPDDFLTRWDLDGSGKVEADEVSSVVWTLLERRSRRWRARLATRLEAPGALIAIRGSIPRRAGATEGGALRRRAAPFCYSLAPNSLLG